MVARARNMHTESFAQYRKNLIEEAQWLKWRIGGGYYSGTKYWSWKRTLAAIKKMMTSGMLGKLMEAPKEQAMTDMNRTMKRKVHLKKQRQLSRMARRVSRGR